MKLNRLLLCCAAAALLCSCDQVQPVSRELPKASLLPKRVVAGYYPNWSAAPMRLRDVNVRYNVMTIFLQQQPSDDDSADTLTFMVPGDGRGAASNFTADMQYVRQVQNRKLIASAGGISNAGMFANRAGAQTFLAQLTALYQQSGGFDGLDWGAQKMLERSQINQMVWVSEELKRRYPGFIITTSPLPWNQTDQDFCAAMLQAGVLDYAAPQFYDGVNQAQSERVQLGVRQWTALVGAAHLVVGMGVNSAANYQSANRAEALWRQLRIDSPDLRGVSDWDIGMDERLGWAFAEGIGAAVLKIIN